MITIHSANHTSEDYKNLATILDAGLESVCRHDCRDCPFEKTCIELNRAILHCLAKSES